MPKENNNTQNNLDAIDTDSNLFETLNNREDYDDDDDSDLLNKELSFEDFDNQEEEEEEFDDNVNFEDEDEEEEEEKEEESNEFNEKEIEILNKKLGTDFKNAEEVKNLLKSTEKESDSEKEAIEYKVLTNKIGLYDRYIGMDNENLVRNQLLSQATGDKKDIEDQNVLDEIEEQIQGLHDLNQLDTFAETLRSNLQTQKDKTQVSIDKIEDKRIETENAIARKNIDNLQNALSDMYIQKEFLGITITKDDVKEVYEDVRTNKFFDRINNNQEMIVKLAMFLKKEEELQKLGNRPTHSDNTKTAFEALTGNQKARRSIIQANGSTSSGNAKDNLMGWLK
jgi:hypothetical protein